MQVLITISSLLLLLSIAHAQLVNTPDDISALSTITKAGQVVSAMNMAEGFRAKRQSPVGTRRLFQNEFNQCQNIAHGVACEIGLQQDFYDLALGCQQQEIADVARFSCAVNDDGVYCSQGAEISQEFATETSSRCTSANFCSSSCRSSISNIRDRLGCCSGYWTALSATRQSNLDGTLWQTCGVSTGELCPLPNFTTPDGPTRFCTEAETARILRTQRCMQNTSGITVETLANTTGCESVAQVHVEECDINSDGEFCALNNELQLAINMIQNCVGSVNGGSCSFSCRSSMRTLRDALGCCVNTHYNNTIARIAPIGYIPNANQLLSYFTNSFWSRCGVTPPGLCNSTVMLPESSVTPEVTTMQPEGTTMRPEGTTMQPEGTTMRPEGTTMQPEGTTMQPEGTTRRPAGTTMRPAGTTMRPGGTTMKPGSQDNGSIQVTGFISVVLMLTLTALLL